MVCDITIREKQTLRERISEVVKAVTALDALIQRRRVKVVVGPQGAITFVGWDGAVREQVSDACAYRRIMATGSALAKMEIARAEQLAGRAVNRQVVGQGVHSHDGGATWHNKG
jgi:hypothetical protein